jgi:hypothetical protein
MIPRFWIYDIYFLGILFYQIDGRKFEFYDYCENDLAFSFYGLSDLASTMLDYQLFIENKT